MDDEEEAWNVRRLSISYCLLSTGITKSVVAALTADPTGSWLSIGKALNMPGQTVAEGYTPLEVGVEAGAA